MRTKSKIVAITLIISIVLTLAACGGKKDLPKYSIGKYEFTVELEKCEESTTGERQSVQLLLTMENEGMPKDFFDKKMEEGVFLLDGKTPSPFYTYSKDKQDNITAVKVTFIMPLGYEFDFNDITIEEVSD
ncbi:MAG: hypothetical protein J6U54_01860 [Clostridiales bacterium]|nr:hypothetical protein [Clostridiales bacterium]